MGGGRKPNSNFGLLKFKLVKDTGGRHAAQCIVCQKTIKNTGAARLRAHRNICKLPETDSSDECIDVCDDSSHHSDSEEEIKILLEDEEEKDNDTDFSNTVTDGEYIVEDNGVLTPVPSSSFRQKIDESQGSVANEEIFEETYFEAGEDESHRFIDDELDLLVTQSTSSITTTPSTSGKSCKKKQSASKDQETVQGTKLNGTGNVTTPTTSSCSRKRMYTSFKDQECSSKKQKNIDCFMDKLNDNDEKNITDALVQMIFGCNLPFSLVESNLFKKFIKAIRPAYRKKIPGRKKLSTTLLDACYENCIKGIHKYIKEESVILCDGWKNTSTNSKIVVAMLHSVDGPNALIDAWDLTTESETGEALAKIMVEAKEIAKQKYNIDTYAIVSDNASAMIKMGTLVKHTMFHSTCSSHTGNLLAKDDLDRKLSENVALVLKEFKQPDFEKMIVMKGGHRIKLPGDTRWCSYRDSFQNLLENLTHIKQIIASTKKKIKPKVTELVFNDDFIDEVQANVKMFEPICNLINTCQKKDASVADAVNLWLDLKVPAKFQECLEKRLDMALNKYALTAYFLHPTYDNSKLSPVHKGKINSFLLKHLNNEGIEEWDKYNTKSGIFDTLYKKEVLKPLLFWRMAQMVSPVLSGLALKLLKIPASSAQIERLFSNWGHIHSLLRNRLTFAHSKKLLHIYFTLKSNEEEPNLSEEVEEEFNLNSPVGRVQTTNQ